MYWTVAGVKPTVAAPVSTWIALVVVSPVMPAATLALALDMAAAFVVSRTTTPIMGSVYLPAPMALLSILPPPTAAALQTACSARATLSAPPVPTPLTLYTMAAVWLPVQLAHI